MLKLDSLDYQILSELDCNSRQSVSAISKKLKQGRDRIGYRIDRLVDEGLIGNFEVIVDLYKLGYNYYKSYLRLESNQTRIASLLHYLGKHKSVYWFSQCDGEWDLIVVMVARAPHEFYNSHLDLLSEFSDIILNFSAFTSVGVTIFSRNFGRQKERVKFTCKNQYYQIGYDQTDLEILRSLSSDSRKSNAEISNEVGASASVVGYRIAEMEKKGIISGYRIGMRLEKIDKMLFKSQLFFKSYDLNLRTEFLNYCDAHPNLIYYITQIGDCNIEIELELHGYQEYYKIMEEIRSKFSKLIRNFSTILVRESVRVPVPPVISQPNEPS